MRPGRQASKNSGVESCRCHLPLVSAWCGTFVAPGDSSGLSQGPIGSRTRSEDPRRGAEGERPPRASASRATAKTCAWRRSQAFCASRGLLRPRRALPSLPPPPPPPPAGLHPAAQQQQQQQQQQRPPWQTKAATATSWWRSRRRTWASRCGAACPAGWSKPLSSFTSRWVLCCAAWGRTAGLSLPSLQLLGAIELSRVG